MYEQQINYSVLLSQLRQRLGLSIALFAKAIGYSSTHLRKMEEGTFIPSNEILSKICDAFDVDPAYFSGNKTIDEAVVAKDRHEEMISIGMRLRQARLEKKLSSRGLSSVTELSHCQICNIERGEFKLTDKRAKQLAEALNVGVDWLVKGDESRKYDPVDDKMAEWLWNHPEVRKQIWEAIRKDNKSL